MTDHELDTLLAKAAAVSDTDIAEWTRTAPFQKLCEEIMSTISVPEQRPNQLTSTRVTVNAGSKSPRRRRWATTLVAVAAAVITLVALGVVVNIRGNDGAMNTAWAAELVEFAERSPLMLMNDPDWIVTYADEYGEEGELTFNNSGTEAELHWRSEPLAEWLDDRLNSGTDLGTHDVVNGTATIVHYDGGNEYTSLWQANGHVLEFRTQSASADGFRALLDSLVVVDVDAWLTAMPASVVGSADQPAVIRGMLVGIPLPDGFDTDSLADDAGIKDRYQLGARVVGAVSCTWIEQWIDATALGDTATAQEAVNAMTTSSQWPIIQEMNQSGAYGQVLQMYVDAMSSDQHVFAPDGPTVADSYQEALGCRQRLG